MLSDSHGRRSHTPDEGSALVPARRHNLGEQVADRLRAAIVDGELAPGDHLGEEELALRLKVSRGPVRSALMLLEREGLTKPAGHKGVVVADLSEADFFEVRTLRSSLEVLAIRLIAATAPEEARTGVGLRPSPREPGLGSSSEGRDAVELDLRFHDAVVAAAGHTRLRQAWSELRLATTMLLLSEATRRPDWCDQMLAEHADISEALTAGDGARAAALMARHIEGSVGSYIGWRGTTRPDS
jgi:DNA-binding GntR family transcriptional regulator